MKLAYIGTGKIIADALNAVSALPRIGSQAIFARQRSLPKARELANQYHIPEVYTDYAQLLRETDADTVYIGLINSAHYPYAKEALLAGKHVILEKPLTGFYAQAKELMTIAQERGLHLLEAITILHNDILPKLKEHLPALGPIRLALLNYSQYSSRYDSYARGSVEHAFDPAYYGGALFDINIYNVHYCAALFGRPLKVSYLPNIGFNGIDTSGVLTLGYAGFTAVCCAAKDSDSRCFVSVQGEQGTLLIDGKPNVAPNLTVTLVDPAGGTVRDAAGAEVRAAKTTHYEAAPVHHRMCPEFAAFARIIDEKDFARSKALMEHSLMVLEILEQARTRAGIEFPIGA